MGFSAFLREYQKQKNFKTVKELFEAFGGESELGISYRQFTSIEKGDAPPSERVLALIFRRLEPQYRKWAVVAWFQTVFRSDPSGDLLVEYISTHLQRAIHKTNQEVWDRPGQKPTYRDEHYDYLNNPKNEEAFKAFKHVLLMDPAPVKRADLRVDTTRLQKLSRLGLISLSGDQVKSLHHRFRSPKMEECTPSTARRVHEYILRHITSYLSFEGTHRQIFKYAMLMVKPAMAEYLRQEIQQLHNFILSVHEPEPRDTDVPFVWAGYGKELERREL